MLPLQRTDAPIVIGNAPAESTEAKPMSGIGPDDADTMMRPGMRRDTRAEATGAGDLTGLATGREDETISPGVPPRGTQATAGPVVPGQPFGTRYHIIRPLGSGGMGLVYQAWDTELGVTDALKVIRPEVTSNPYIAREMERRFKRELLLAREVSHNNVVRIHDLGEISGIKYITMSYVEGRDLATILDAEPRLTPTRALHIIRGVVAGPPGGT